MPSPFQKSELAPAYTISRRHGPQASRPPPHFNVRRSVLQQPSAPSAAAEVRRVPPPAPIPPHHTHTRARLWEASRDPPARLLRSRPTLPFVVAQTAASGPRLRLQRAPRVHIFGFVDLLLTVKIGREPTGSQKIRRLPPTSSWTRQKTKKSPDHPEPPARSGGSEPAQFTQKKHPAPRKAPRQPRLRDTQADSATIF